ncbi:17165_t:CDS:2 [Entrophospora sp. SA101]|nr:2884_t:CDS:2 [Entrophospora sp. SA101]CAJ0761415.1 17165_t:CDS:2 [Entrophospora sp. SA101]
MALNVSLTCSLQFPQKLIIQQLMQQPPPMRQPLIQRLPMQQAIGIPVINTGIVNPSQSIAATGDIDNMIITITNSKSNSAQIGLLIK